MDYAVSFIVQLRDTVYTGWVQRNCDDGTIKLVI